MTMITPPLPEQIERIRASFKQLSPHADELTRVFFTRLFTAGPAVRALFPRESFGDGPGRGQDLIASLGIVVKNLHRLDAVEHLLMDMGARNQRAGAQPQHYGLVRDALLAAMRDIQGPTWNDEVHADWCQTFNIVASVMIRGAGHARRAA